MIQVRNSCGRLVFLSFVKNTTHNHILERKIKSELIEFNNSICSETNACLATERKKPSSIENWLFFSCLNIFWNDFIAKYSHVAVFFSKCCCYTLRYIYGVWNAWAREQCVAFQFIFKVCTFNLQSFGFFFSLSLLRARMFYTLKWLIQLRYSS